MIPQNITADSVLKAIAEIGRDGIPYHRQAVKYDLVHKGKKYPPKYVLSLANRFSNGNLLEPDEFSGGPEANDFLRDLGFVVEQRSDNAHQVQLTLVQGMECKRAELHRLYGGQQRGGISTPKDHPFVMIFTGKAGAQYGYRDEWEKDVFLFTGEGQKGDMQLTKGNLAITSHTETGKSLYLFELTKKGHCRFMNEMACVGLRWEQGPDRDGNNRKIVRFELVPVEGHPAQPGDGIDEKELSELWNMPLGDLRRKAQRASVDRTPSKTGARHRYRQRSAAIAVYVKRRADGVCESCEGSAPFTNSRGEPYLEAHHIYRLADDGPDAPDKVIALCPNCHCRAHYSEDSDVYNAQLSRRA